MERISIELTELPKVSLNQWYSGKHWSKRKTLKDNYTYIVKSQFKKVFKKNCIYKCKYVFEFKSRPLDCSNCVAMVKLIEDIIFEDDNYKIIPQITIESKKSKIDKLTIEIEVI